MQAWRLYDKESCFDLCAVEKAGDRAEEWPWSRNSALHRSKKGRGRVGQALAKSGVMDRLVALGMLPVEVIILMKSALSPTGSVYRKLWEVRLSEN